MLKPADEVCALGLEEVYFCLCHAVLRECFQNNAALILEKEEKQLQIDLKSPVRITSIHLIKSQSIKAQFGDFLNKVKIKSK